MCWQSRMLRSAAAAVPARALSTRKVQSAVVIVDGMSAGCLFLSVESVTSMVCHLTQKLLLVMRAQYAANTRAEILSVV
jgi:hypothetical protein